MRLDIGVVRTREPFARMVLAGAAATSVYGFVACGVLAAVDGPVSCLNAGVAAFLVLILFVAGALGVHAVLGSDARAAASALMGALVVYVGQLTLGTALVLVLRDLPGLDRDAIAIGGLGAALAWQVGMVAGFLTSRVLVFEPATATTPAGSRP